MYFLSEDERKYLLKGLIPKTHQTEIADELRGWTWPQPPVEPVYPVKLALYEVAGRYCPTGRDVYLRHVTGVKPEPTVAMLQGTLFHTVISSVLIEAKRLIYLHGVEGYRSILNELTARIGSSDLPQEAQRLLQRFPQGECAGIMAKARILRDFEVSCVVARLQDILVRQQHIGTDSLAASAIPVVLEQKVDGSFLGLSSWLSVDAYTFSEVMILDTKFARRRDFHRLTTTGYAMVCEALTEYPINIGCVVYGRFEGDRLLVEKDFHVIDDELRQQFIEERDSKARMVYEEHDPGVSQDCSRTCGLWTVCHPA
jgi:CRISPR-associated protein Csa1